MGKVYTEEDIEKIKKLYTEGYSDNDIADELNRSPAAIGVLLCKLRERGDIANRRGGMPKRQEKEHDRILKKSVGKPVYDGEKVEQEIRKIAKESGNTMISDIELLTSQGWKVLHANNKGVYVVRRK